MAQPPLSVAALLEQLATSVPFRPREVDDDARSMYSAADREVLATVGRALFDEGDDLEARTRIEWFVNEADAFFASWTGPARLLAIAAPKILLWSPVLVGWGWFPITGLPRDLQVEVLLAMERSETDVLAELYSAIKVLLCSVYLEHPDVLPSMEIDLNGMHPISHNHKEAS